MDALDVLCLWLGRVCLIGIISFAIIFEVLVFGSYFLHLFKKWLKKENADPNEVCDQKPK